MSREEAPAIAKAVIIVRLFLADSGTKGASAIPVLLVSVESKGQVSVKLARFVRPILLVQGFDELEHVIGVVSGEAGL